MVQFVDAVFLCERQLPFYGVGGRFGNRLFFDVVRGDNRLLKSYDRVNFSFFSKDGGVLLRRRGSALARVENCVENRRKERRRYIDDVLCKSRTFESGRRFIG